MQIVPNKQLVKDAAVRPKIAPLVSNRRMHHLWAHVDMGAHVAAGSALLRVEQIDHIADADACVMAAVPKSMSILDWLRLGK